MAEKSIPSPRPRSEAPRSEHRFVRYLREVWTELKKTNWPSREELIAQTQVVLGVLFALGVFVALWDRVLGAIIQGLLGILGISSTI